MVKSTLELAEAKPEMECFWYKSDNYLLELAEAKPEMECYWYKSDNYLFDEKKYFTNLRSIQKAL